MEVKLVLLTEAEADHKALSKTYSSVNRDYIGLKGSTAATLPYGYDSFWDWAETVARSLAQLGNDSYSDSTITATFTLSEEE